MTANVVQARLCTAPPRRGNYFRITRVCDGNPPETGGFTSKAAVTRGFDIVLVNWLLDVEQTAHLLVNRDATVIEWSPMGFPPHVSDTQEPEQCHEPGPVLQFTQSLSGLSSWRWWQISRPYYQNYLSVCITKSSNRYTNAIILVLHYIYQNMDMQAAYKTFQ